MSEDPRIRITDDPIDRRASDLLPAGFDPLESMRVLTDYIRNLEMAYNDLIKKSTFSQRNIEAALRAATKSNDDLEKERERLTKELIHISSQIEELESLLGTANQKVSNFEKQAKELHRINEDLENRLSKEENNCNFYITELTRLKNDYEAMSLNMTNVNTRNDDLERKLAAERTQTMSHEKECRRLTSSISEAQGKIQFLEQKRAEMATLRDEELKKLQERLASDARHEVAVLKKRVKTALGPEMLDIHKLGGEKLSSELASNLKALIGRLVSKLEQLGFELK
ncbi:MAG: hypothetical protein LBU12_09295 [Deltaproteobacteria bacterium]|jgi:chromosome segregation ATPase|nr:hypothetical protein [Deltaproteobacteria bacterium]